MYTIPHKAIRFKPSYEIKEDIEIPTFNHGKDWVVGAVEEEPKDLQGMVFIAKPAEFGNMEKNVWLDTSVAHAVYIVGKRRSGKSYTLGVLAEGLALCDKKQAILIFDTMNVFWTLEHHVEVIDNSEEANTLKEWGLQVLDRELPVECYYFKNKEIHYPTHYQRLTLRASDLEGEDWAALFGKDVFSDPIGQLLAELVESVTEGYDSSQGKTPPRPDYTIDDMLLCLERNPSISRYEIKTIEAVRRYLMAVKRTDIFSEKGINIHDIFKPGQISVLLLRDLDPLVRGLVIGIIVKKIMYYRAIGSDYEKRKALILKTKNLSKVEKEEMIKDLEKNMGAGITRGWILIDEAHNYIPKGEVIASKKLLIKYINEGRNIGLSIAVATQRPSGLDSSIIRNADILLIHSISMGEDIKEVRDMLNTSPMGEVKVEGKELSKQAFENAVRTLRTGYVIISDEMSSRVYIAKMRPRLTLHGGKEIW
jgi:hypothetical protein